MLVSTKGRYALRVMTDLAMHEQGRYIPLKEMAERQSISQKYMEAIMTSLIVANGEKALMNTDGIILISAHYVR